MTYYSRNLDYAVFTLNSRYKIIGHYKRIRLVVCMHPEQRQLFGARAEVAATEAHTRQTRRGRLTALRSL